jgi:hypothetical protein
MKTFKEYLAESKKVYQFKIKVAGDLPEKFQESLKTQLGRVEVKTFEKIETTPIQATPLDFPNLSNMEVHIFNLVCEYPVTSPEIVNDLKAIGLTEECFRVRGEGEQTEDHDHAMCEPSGEALLDETDLDKASTKIKHKDYFGNDFNKGFLKDLEKTAKARKKEDGQGEYKLPKGKADKAGTKSALGS